MRLTKMKKESIRMALVNAAFGDRKLEEALKDLVDVLYTSPAMQTAIAAKSGFTMFVNSSSTLHVLLDGPGIRRRGEVTLPYEYARMNAYSDLELVGEMDADGVLSFSWSGWRKTEGLPDLSGENLKAGLEKAMRILEERRRLDRQLADVMERITTAKGLATKIPASAIYLTEELESERAQQKALLPQEVVQRIRQLLGSGAA